ncbi:amino acid permease [Weissella cibaria]|uniref:amino acid permease n=1 Tax=Weissella TaxID=46255 RepID=UPI0002191582|nr:MULTISPECIES: amino acid permease [Weissella]APS26593.1 D-serine/D-alanine/glycine transporter [Weissella cibaria]APU61990.1 D-serine/D-alanine/glycine transporter [Weissella cibaria]APU64141.1 D-serine/D-alanine/glycine transporter [Weissella cibaria]ASS52476.1 D-serine/D-alanine/glycine transporter [Weissella cibaria]KXU06195.1 D-serine/D-alanine/glycine transporter [Weissella sp. DD23]
MAQQEASQQKLERGLSSRHVEMIALGGTIGTGLFLGAGHSISTAGPAILLVYIITGLFMFWMMRALGELLLTDPDKPTFVGFVEKYLGKKAGFVIGWTYWIGWITIAMAELTAVGTYMKFWFPGIPVWIWEIIFLVALYGINVIAVSAFGETEFWFSMIKIVAIVAMIVAGIIMIVTHAKTSAGVTSLSNLWQHGVIAHHGHKLLAAFQMVFFAFLGIEFVGMTAAEAKDPLTTIPKSINSIIIRILIFYVGALVAIMSIQPWTNYSASESPFVQVFSGIGITAAAGIINFVVLTAAASSLNSSLFTTGRMLFSLSNGKGYVGKLNRRYIPRNAINVSAVLIALAVLVNVFFPSNAFDLVTSVASAAFVVIYGVLVFAHLRYRQSADFKNGEKRFLMPGAPFTDYLTLAFLFGIFMILLFTKSTMPTTLLALAWFVIMIALSRRVKD